MKQYDFVIVGAGASGLSLACHLAASPLRDRSILLIERSLHARADRTWAFWASTTSVPFDRVRSHSWRRLIVAAPGHEQSLRTDPYSYGVIRGADFYRFAYEMLAPLSNIEIVEGRVEGIEDSEDGARVSVEGQEYKGRWVFDSRFRLAGFQPGPRYHCLKMQFRGWEIESSEPCFDPRAATFLDFRTPQRKQARFLYVLPYDEQHALVEFVACVPRADKLLHTDEQQAALKEYIEGTLGVANYRVSGQEQGVNPMTDYPFPRRVGSRVMTIGIPGGMLKPTTGFAFTRIQRDSAAIVNSLLKRGNPWHVPHPRRGYRLYERLMLGMMERHGDQVGSMLATFFRLGSTPHILRFLDEQGLPV